MKNIKILILLMLCSFGLSAQIINDNTDVNTSGNEVNQALIWDGTNWVNAYTQMPGYPYAYAYSKDIAADNNITTITAFNGGTATYNATEDALRVTGDNNAKGCEIQYTHTANVSYLLRIDVKDPGNEGIKVRSQWAANLDAITAAGVYYIPFTSPATVGAFGKEVILTTNQATAGVQDTFFVSRIDIWQETDEAGAIAVNSDIARLDARIDTIGKNDIVYFTNSGAAGTGSVLIRGDYAGTDEVVIGKGATGRGLNAKVIAIGYNSDATWNNVYGGAAGPESISIGEESRSMAWRGTAIGGSSVAGATSATAIGAAAVSLKSHGVALGRGAFLPHPDSTVFLVDVDVVLGGDGATDMWIGNSWGHKFNLELYNPKGIDAQDFATPSTREQRLHGQDAYNAYDDGTSINVSAGDVALVAGLATGSGESGSVNFYIGEGNNGANVKDTTKKAGEFRSDEAATTGTFFWLLNEATGTMQRVVIDTKPAVSGTNGIVGFSKGYKPE